MFDIYSVFVNNCSQNALKLQLQNLLLELLALLAVRIFRPIANIADCVENGARFAGEHHRFAVNASVVLENATVEKRTPKTVLNLLYHSLRAA